jgi:hypothetical protein
LYVCACACLGCIVVVLWNVAIRSTACYSGPLNGTIATHCCSSQLSVFSLPYFGFWDLIHIPFDVIIRSWPKITDDWPGMIHLQYGPLHAYTLLCFEIVHKFCHSEYTTKLYLAWCSVKISEDRTGKDILPCPSIYCCR